MDDDTRRRALAALDEHRKVRGARDLRSRTPNEDARTGVTLSGNQIYAEDLADQPARTSSDEFEC